MVSTSFDDQIESLFSLRNVNATQKDIIKRIAAVKGMDNLALLLPSVTPPTSRSELPHPTEMRHSYFFDDGSILGLRADISFELDNGRYEWLFKNGLTCGLPAPGCVQTHPKRQGYRLFIFDAGVPLQFSERRDIEFIGKHSIYLQGWFCRIAGPCYFKR